MEDVLGFYSVPWAFPWLLNGEYQQSSLVTFA